MYFSKFTKPQLKDFPTFKRVIHDFLDFFDLNGHNLKEIDKYLWMYGKEMFPAKYY